MTHVSMSMVLADDHDVLLDGVAAALERQGHRVLARVHSYAELSRTLRTLRPMLALTEVRLRDGSLGALELLAKQHPDTRLVVLTANPDQQTMQAALAAGVCGYVHKTRCLDNVLHVLDRVARGEVVIEGSFRRRAPQRAAAPPHVVRLVTQLTPREQECLSLISAGHDTAAMARELGVTSTTVRSHVQSLLNKLGVHSRLEAAAMTARFQLVPRADSSVDTFPVHAVPVHAVPVHTVRATG